MGRFTATNISFWALLALLVAVVASLIWVMYLPTCAQEDSTNCIWLAGFMGNGEGRSFIDLFGTAYYFIAQ